MRTIVNLPTNASSQQSTDEATTLPSQSNTGPADFDTASNNIDESLDENEEQFSENVETTDDAGNSYDFIIEEQGQMGVSECEYSIVIVDYEPHARFW